MKNKTTLILICSIIVIIVAFFIFYKVKQLEKTSYLLPAQPSQSISGFPLPSPNDPTMTIKTPSGNLSITNIYQKSLANLSNDGVSFEDNSYYYMAYYPENQGFLIVLQNSDVQTARKKAEKDFLRILKIEKEAACQLNISITIPFDINPLLSGQVYGLSFCPNAKSF